MQRIQPQMDCITGEVQEVQATDPKRQEMNERSEVQKDME